MIYTVQFSLEKLFFVPLKLTILSFQLSQFIISSQPSSLSLSFLCQQIMVDYKLFFKNVYFGSLYYLCTIKAEPLFQCLSNNSNYCLCSLLYLIIDLQLWPIFCKSSSLKFYFAQECQSGNQFSSSSMQTFTFLKLRDILLQGYKE